MEEKNWFRAGVIALFLLLPAPSHAQEHSVTPDEAIDALHRAVRFFRESISAEGGYVYLVSADLTKFEGEGVVSPMTAWIEPPGTPSVGMAYLEGFQRTGDSLLLEAAVETGMALVRGQLESGGWDNGIEFDPEERRRYAYRVDKREDVGALRNTTTFDDDKSQSALRFLMRLDRVLAFENEPIHEAVEYALEAFLRAQYPNGAWPQRYDAFPDPDAFPVMPASYPASWPRTFPDEDYRNYYTLNDDTIGDMIETMFTAYDIYHDGRFLESARLGGEFFLLAQMPDPQPGWAQQYNRDMHPAWARRFEPPSISGGESQGVMMTLMRLYDRTGDERFMEPIPRALAYYRASLRPDGRLARFYELETNRPLYFTKDYQLTYSDADMPTHYAFIVDSRLDSISEEYQRLRERRPSRGTSAIEPSTPVLSDSLVRRTRSVIDALDERGAWVEEGRLRYHGEDDETRRIIRSRTFVDHMEILTRFIAAASDE